jgi:putative transposase
MDNHYHLVVECTRVTLSAGVQRLSGIHAERINARHARTGHLFGERFGARVIDTEERLANTVAYVLANPVRAGLCEKPEDWPWSGSRGAAKTNKCSSDSKATLR